MKFLCLFAFVSVAAAAFSELKLEQCGGDGSVVVRHIDVTPMPVKLPGKLNVVLDASLLRDIRDPIDIKVRLYTKTWAGWFKFPLCIREVGSCDYDDICKRLEVLRDKGCPKDELAKLGINIPRCTCPLPAADLQLAFRDIDLPAIPKYLSIFTAGDYKIEGRVYEAGKEISCFRAFLSLA